MGLEVHVLDLGDIELDTSFLVLAQDPGRRQEVPTFGFLITGGEAPVVGVMDPDAVGADGEQADPTATPVAAGEAEGAEVEEPEAVGAARATSSGSLLQTVPALRPMSSWLRRDPHGEEPAGS